MTIKIRLVILVATLLVSMKSQGLLAQQDIYISLNSGVSFPVGQFSGTTLNEDSFAKPGISFGAEAVWFFHPFIGIGIEGNINNNPLDVTKLTSEKFKEDPFLEELSIRSESFKTTTFSGGVFGRYGINKKWTAHVKILAGFMRCHTPYQLYRTQYFQVGPTYYEITSSRDDAFVLIPGIGIQYLFSRGIGFKLDGEFQSQQMSFPFQTSSGITHKERKVSYFQLILGMLIKI